MKNLMIITMALGLFAGCSTTEGLSYKERNEAYLAYIEKQPLVAQDRIRAYSFSGWRALSNNYLIISTSPKRKYLLEISGFCPNLNHAQTIAFNQSMSGSLETRFDSISIPESPGSKCTIKSIFKITKAQAEEINALDKLDNGKKI